MKTLHVLGLSRTVTSKTSECETTQKIFKFCKIFENHSKYKIIHYGHNKSSTAAQTHVNVTSDEVLYSVLNAADDEFSQGYYDLASRVFRNNAIREILARKAKGDFVLAFDVEAKGITDELNHNNDLVVMEPSVSGAEDKVVRGMGELRPTYIYAETNLFGSSLYETTTTLDKFDAMMGSLGYNLFDRTHSDTMYVLST